MFQYLTPTTLEEMYKDLDEARLDLLSGVNEHNLIDKAAEYSKLTDMLQDIDSHYENLTGQMLWVVLASEAE